jgi:hypothetical protein
VDHGKSDARFRFGASVWLEAAQLSPTSSPQEDNQPKHPTLRRPELKLSHARACPLGPARIFRYYRRHVTLKAGNERCPSTSHALSAAADPVTSMSTPACPTVQLPIELKARPQICESVRWGLVDRDWPIVLTVVGTCELSSTHRRPRASSEVGNKETRCSGCVFGVGIVIL